MYLDSTNIIVGIDPSYSRTGIAIYDPLKEELFTTECKCTPTPDKSFEQLARDCYGQVNRIYDVVRGHADLSRTQIWMECPPPQGMYSPGLYALDVGLAMKFYDAGVVDIYRFYPTYVNHLHGKRKYPKSESVTLAEGMLAAAGIEHEGRMCHDTAEAIMFMLRGLVANNSDREIVRDLVAVYPVMKEEHEKSIFE